MRRIFALAVVLMIASGVAGAYQEKSKADGGKDAAKAEKTKKDVNEPVLVSKVTPAYPAEAKKNKVEGEVVMRATIGTDGSVLKAEAVKSPDPALSAAAVDAVKQWKYKPATTKEGKPIQVTATITVNFKLK